MAPGKSTIKVSTEEGSLRPDAVVALEACHRRSRLSAVNTVRLARASGAGERIPEVDQRLLQAGDGIAVLSLAQRRLVLRGGLQACAAGEPR